MTFALPSLARLRDAAHEIREVMPETPAYRWPLLERELGLELWVKHENHAPTGAFKVRGGITYFNGLRRNTPYGVICATRGNHGASIAFNAARTGIAATIVVPHGNSAFKNAAMSAYGARLIEHGHDFQAALERARELAAREGLHMIASFHPELVRGVATAGLELFESAPDLQAVYAPIGMGSGVCGLLAARDALGSQAEVVGVVSEGAATYVLSCQAGRPVESPVATLADGMAVRLADADAVAAMLAAKVRFVVVSDDEILVAMRDYFDYTRNVAEPAGAASLAAAKKDARGSGYMRVGVVLSGGNVELDVFASTFAAAFAR